MLTDEELIKAYRAKGGNVTVVSAPTIKYEPYSGEEESTEPNKIYNKLGHRIYKNRQFYNISMTDETVLDYGN